MKRNIYELLRKYINDDLKYIIFIFYSSFLKVIFSPFYLLSVDNKKICIRNYEGKGYGDNPKYIIESLLEDTDDFEIIWLVKRKTNDIQNPKVKFKKINSLNGFYHMATSKFWILNTRIPIYIKKKSSQIYIQTWHGGIGIKKIEGQVKDSLSKNYIKTAQNDSKNIDFLISNSDYRTKLYRKYFWYDGKILEIGLPRNDYIINNPLNRENALKNIGVLDNEKILIYTPTFRRNHKLDYYRIDYDNLIKSLNIRFGGKWKVILRLHPIISSYSMQLSNSNIDVIDLSNYDDIYEILPFCDAMISDYSSIMFDFMMLKKPVFIFATDIFEYRKDRDFNIPIDQLPFPIATNNEELNIIIRNYSFEEFQKQRNEFILKYGVKETGNASKYISKLIQDYVRKEV